MNKIIKESLVFFLFFLLVYAIVSSLQGSFNWGNILLTSVTAGIFYGIFRGILLHFRSN